MEAVLDRTRYVIAIACPEHLRVRANCKNNLTRKYITRFQLSKMMFFPYKELQDTDCVLAYLKAPRPVKYFFFDSPFFHHTLLPRHKLRPIKNPVSPESYFRRQRQHDNVQKGCRNHYPSFPK
jgi:hypothetical protein